MTPRPLTRQRGAVLIVAMVVLFALAAVTLAMSHRARVDAMASANSAASIEAAAIARGAEQWVLTIIGNEGAAVVTRPETDFQQRPLGNGWFWIIRPDYSDADLPTFGLTDEAGKLNINEASVESLRALPGISEEAVAAILDWRDEDDEARPNGAESSYYLSLAEPHEAKNAPFEFVEELLLVRGVDEAWLLGTTGTADDPATASILAAPAFGEPALRSGLFPYLTVFSRDPGLTNDGLATINANIRNERDQLRERFAERLTQSRADEIVDSMGRQDLRDVFDLYYRAQMKPEELRAIEDIVRTSNQQERAGMINVNTAPREVLLCVEGLTENDVNTLLARRPTAVAAYPGTMTWVVEALGQRAIGLGEHIVARSYQFSADIVAVSGDGRAFRRVRLVADAAGGEPRVLYRRDVTHEGWPLDPGILASLRSGAGLPPAMDGRLQ